MNNVNWVDANLQTFRDRIKGAGEVVMMEVIILIEFPTARTNRRQMHGNEEAVDNCYLRRGGPKRCAENLTILGKVMHETSPVLWIRHDVP